MERGRSWLEGRRLQLSKQERVWLEDLSSHNKEGGCGKKRKMVQVGASKAVKRKRGRGSEMISG